MAGSLVEIVLILLLIVANGAFAMAETAIVAARKARLQQWAEEGDAQAKAALDLASSPENLLATVQIGITLIGILAGAFGGASVAQGIAAWMKGVPALAPYSQTLSFVLVVAAITYLSLVIGELTPKHLALGNPERIARMVAPPMRVLSRVATPLVHLLGWSTRTMMWLLRVRPSTDPPVTEEEIRVMIDQGTEAGVFEEAEQDLVESVFRLGDRRVNALMTPRPDIEWLDLEDSPEALKEKVLATRFSRLPVGEGSLDELVGIVSVKELLRRACGGEGLDLRAAVKPALVVPESTRALKVLEAFKQQTDEIAVVTDEYGTIQGVVSLTDMLESLVGELSAEALPGEDADVVRREDGSLLLDGALPLDEVKDLLSVRSLPGEDEGFATTLGGFVMSQLGRVPAPADHFTLAGWRFEVIDMDGRRVDKVLVARSGE